ncbi:hypothetical protein [Sporomusa aerivorans]|uniref:hypothetical protein n=1 Tax=Sporomusa aerivorans TaxID=204936 RepID=UPI00352B5533
MKKNWLSNQLFHLAHRKRRYCLLHWLPEDPSWGSSHAIRLVVNASCSRLNGLFHKKQLYVVSLNNLNSQKQPVTS